MPTLQRRYKIFGSYTSSFDHCAAKSSNCVLTNWLLFIPVAIFRRILALDCNVEWIVVSTEVIRDIVCMKLLDIFLDYLAWHMHVDLSATMYSTYRNVI